jgi:hypothetical protein
LRRPGLDPGVVAAGDILPLKAVGELRAAPLEAVCQAPVLVFLPQFVAANAARKHPKRGGSGNRPHRLAALARTGGCSRVKHRQPRMTGHRGSITAPNAVPVLDPDQIDAKRRAPGDAQAIPGEADGMLQDRHEKIGNVKYDEPGLVNPV